MKIKLFILCLLSNELFAFMTPADMLDRMTLKNAKNMMLMPLHPEQKIEQGLRLMEEASRLFEYEITELSKKSARSVRKVEAQNLR